MNIVYYNLYLTFFALLGIILGVYQLNKVSINYIPKVENKVFDKSLVVSKWSDTYKPEEKSKPQESASFPNLELTATSVGFRSFALLKINGKSYVVSQGQVIQGLKVLKITNSFVVVSYNSNQKTIKLGEVIKQSANANQQNPNAPLNLPPLDTLLSSSSNKIPKSELERITADPGIMFTQIRLIPYVENGQTKGFRFDWIQDGSLFQKMGLQVGDVLVAINNQQINSGEDAFRILQIIRNEPNFKVTILRNGKTMELNYFVE
ncbi:MAG: type II secretion system protein GspC [Sulfurihydrogenibium sp.]|uniref:type II secretion system protein GspC n=1 Tax=Sulfurihydrogenibium sp. TaxID=2053621 RepID=UPI003C7CF9DA